MSSPTARTLNALRKSGYIAAVVERWIAHAKLRRDCFGFADVLAAHPLRREIILIQATTIGNMAARVRKVQRNADAPCWIQTGGKIEVWGWVKRASRWRVKIVALKADDMRPEIVTRPARKPRGNEIQGLLF